MLGRVDWRHGSVLAMAWTALLFLVMPMFVIVPVSLTPHRYLSLPDDEISFRHFVNMFTNEAWLSSIGDSLIVAISATVVAVLLGTLCAIGCWRLATRGSEMVRMLMLTPIIVPPIVHALGFYKVWVDLGLLDSYLGVILAHVLIGMPFVVITVSAALVNFDVQLEQAARNLGASMAQTVRMVIIPSIMPGVISGAIFAFIMSWDEIVVVLFITSRAVYTLPRKMWDGIQENYDPTIAAVATVLILVTFIFLFVHLLLKMRQSRQAVVEVVEG